MKLLFVDCCISQRGENSRTAALAEAYLEGFRSAHPDAQVETVTPQTLLNLRPFDVPALNEREALAALTSSGALLGSRSSPPPNT